MHDTPLGQYISIRSETDSKIIKNFSPSEKEIYNDWKKYRTKEVLNNMSIEEKQRQVLSFQKAMKEAFFKGGK